MFKETFLQLLPRNQKDYSSQDMTHNNTILKNLK